MPNDDTKLADEIAAVIMSDVRVRFQRDASLTQREVQNAIIESARTLGRDLRSSLSRTPATRT
jgi:predicted transcriptional regulator